MRYESDPATQRPGRTVASTLLHPGLVRTQDWSGTSPTANRQEPTKMISGNLGAAESSAAPLPPFPEDPILAASAEGPFIFCEGQQGQCGHASVIRQDDRLNLHTGSALCFPAH